jgi:hypothetical protein
VLKSQHDTQLKSVLEEQRVRPRPLY